MGFEIGGEGRGGRQFGNMDKFRGYRYLSDSGWLPVDKFGYNKHSGLSKVGTSPREGTL